MSDPVTACTEAQIHAVDNSHYVVVNLDGARALVTWECQECGERGSSS